MPVALSRKKAWVFYIDILTAADDGKQGIDDALAAGHDLTELIGSAYPAPDVMPALGTDGTADSDAPELERVRTENMRLQQLASAQAELLRNPHLKDKPRMVGFAAITEAVAKGSRGEVEPDGRIRLEISRVVNDFRPKTRKGETTLDRNPHDGSFPLTSRDNGKSALKFLAEHGAIDAEFVPVRRQHGGGDWYNDTDILIRVTTPVEDIRQLASFHGYKKRQEYRKQEPCSHCGEVHARTVETVGKTYCGTS